MTYELKLTQQQVQVIAQALGELPLKVALATFSDIQRQVQEQDEASAIEVEQ